MGGSSPAQATHRTPTCNTHACVHTQDTCTCTLKHAHARLSPTCLPGKRLPQGGREVGDLGPLPQAHMLRSNTRTDRRF